MNRPPLIIPFICVGLGLVLCVSGGQLLISIAIGMAAIAVLAHLNDWDMGGGDG